MKIRYNAPVILTFSLACTGVFILESIFGIPSGFTRMFTVPGNNEYFQLLSLDAIRLVSYTLGHQTWDHLIGNLSFILLIGPVLEEKYGSIRMIIMILITALATGFFNVLFLDRPSLGASGIVFMFILLISVTNVRKGEIPLTLIAVIAIFITKEVIQMFQPNNPINEAAHLIGGLFGGIFGFIFAREKKIKTDDSTLPPDSMTQA